MTAETACREIRQSLRVLAEAERNQGFALHLMTGARTTPMVEARLAELQGHISDLRELLRKLRHQAPIDDSRVEHCLKLGFRSLVEAETLARDVEKLVAGSGPFGGPVKRGKSAWAEFPKTTRPAPSVPDASSHAAPR